MQDYFSLSMTTRDVNQISALGLAHCGDAVFELMVRSWLCLTGGPEWKICTGRRSAMSAPQPRRRAWTGCCRC